MSESTSICRVSVRNARPDDAECIGRGVAMALGREAALEYAGERAVEVFAEIAAVEEAQYSYRNALIAEVDGERAGIVIGYDGAQLERLREGSLSVIRRYNPGIVVTDDETDASEFYLDTLAVLPRFRRHGIGRMLIDAIKKRARDCGKDAVGLLVDFSNPGAERLYRSLGFDEVGQRPFFGHMMKHLQHNIL